MSPVLSHASAATLPAVRLWDRFVAYSNSGRRPHPACDQPAHRARVGAARAAVLRPRRLPVGARPRGQLEGHPPRARRRARVPRRPPELPGHLHRPVSRSPTTTAGRPTSSTATASRASRTALRCPETTRLVESVPGMETAMFSILSPGKHIPPHHGPYKGVLRYHLGLLVPEPEDQLGISVGGQVAHWSEGESLVFDDTFEHSAWNDTDAHACRAVPRRGARDPRADEGVQPVHDQGDRILAVHPGREAPPRSLGTAIRPDARRRNSAAEASVLGQLVVVAHHLEHHLGRFLEQRGRVVEHEAQADEPEPA